jgi:hypothetical protein
LKTKKKIKSENGKNENGKNIYWKKPWKVIPAVHAQAVAMQSMIRVIM